MPPPKPTNTPFRKKAPVSRTLAPVPYGLVRPEPGKEITALKAADADGRAMAIYVGKTRVARVETNWAMEAGIRECDEWTQELADNIYTAAKDYAAYQHALHLMTTQQRSAFKLVQKLKQTGHEAVDAQAAADRLKELKLVDDEALAERLAEDLARSGKLGQRGIENKLRAKGIDAALAKTAAQAASRELGDPDAAMTQATKRAQRLMNLEPQVARRRLYGFLIRRGFDHDEASKATAAALSAQAKSDLH